MYTLHADAATVGAGFAKALYNAALNVKLRLEHEQGRHQEARSRSCIDVHHRPGASARAALNSLSGTCVIRTICTAQVLELVAPHVDQEKRRVAIQLYGDRVKRYLKLQNFLQIKLLNLSRSIVLFNDY